MMVHGHNEPERELDVSLAWLQRVVDVDYEYITRWERAYWHQWNKALHADRHAPCPALPRWMQPLTGPWYRDFGLPFPTVAQLWPTAHDWFAEADAHGDFALDVVAPVNGPLPTLDALRRAWVYAASRGGTPLLSLCVVPDDPAGEAVVGEIEAFYVIVPSLDLALGAELIRVLELPYFVSGVGAADDALYYAGLSAPPVDATLLSWEWAYS